ncbi:hypothetical protein, partial [Lactiplantibacillus plantarum]
THRLTNSKPTKWHVLIIVNASCFRWLPVSKYADLSVKWTGIALLMTPAENGVRSTNNASAGVICGAVVIETGSQSNNDVTASDNSSIVIY